MCTNPAHPAQITLPEDIHDIINKWMTVTDEKINETKTALRATGVAVGRCRPIISKFEPIPSRFMDYIIRYRDGISRIYFLITDPKEVLICLVRDHSSGPWDVTIRE